MATLTEAKVMRSVFQKSLELFIHKWWRVSRQCNLHSRGQDNSQNDGSNNDEYLYCAYDDLFGEADITLFSKFYPAPVRPPSTVS